MSLRQGSNDSESPAEDDREEVDAADVADAENPAAERNPDAEAAPEIADTPPAEQADAEVAEVADETPPKPKASKPSPVDQAIEQLTTPADDAAADQPGARKATDPAATKPTDGEQPAAKPATPGQKNDEPAADDALNDWSPEERKHTKGRVKERFRTLHQKTRELQPFANVGQEWSGFVKKHGLADDLQVLPDEGMTVAIRTQAAALRVVQAARSKAAVPENDLALLIRNREAIDQVLGMAGRPIAPPAAPVEDHSKIEITQEVRDLKDAFGALKDEDEMRAVQAALNRVRGQKAKPAAQPAPAPVAVAAPAAHAAAAPPAPVAAAKPWSAEDERLAQHGMVEDIIASGVKREGAHAHYTTNLAPLVTAKVGTLYPGHAPDAVWERLSPQSRRELVREAQGEWARTQPAKTPARPTRAPTPPPVQGTGLRRAPLSRPAIASGKGAVDAAIAHMSGEENE